MMCIYIYIYVHIHINTCIHMYTCYIYRPFSHSSSHRHGLTARHWLLPQHHVLLCFLMVSTWPLLKPDRHRIFRELGPLVTIGPPNNWETGCYSSPHMRCTQTKSGRGSKAASARSCSPCSHSWPGEGWMKSREHGVSFLIINYFSEFWIDQKWRTWKTEIIFRCMVNQSEWSASLYSCLWASWVWTKREMPRKDHLNKEGYFLGRIMFFFSRLGHFSLIPGFLRLCFLLLCIPLLLPVCFLVSLLFCFSTVLLLRCFLFFLLRSPTPRCIMFIHPKPS